MNGLTDFKRFLREFKNLSLWGAASSALLPFIASFLAIIPPWPPRLDVITAAVQLITLVVVYQGFKNNRNAITRSIRRLAFAAFVILLGYMVLFSIFTIYVPQAKRSIVIGYECTAKALSVFRDHCPHLTIDDLATVAYDEFVLWTKASIAVTRAALIGVWMTLFILFASILGQFLIIQMRTAPQPQKIPKDKQVRPAR
jgi:hypothetical protein